MAPALNLLLRKRSHLLFMAEPSMACFVYNALVIRWYEASTLKGGRLEPGALTGGAATDGM